MIVLSATWVEQEDSYTAQGYDIFAGESKVGTMSVFIDTDSAYIERIDIHEESRSNGYGTEAIRTIASEHKETFAAPDNEGSRRLMDRIGTVTDRHGEVNQGFGVYEF